MKQGNKLAKGGLFSKSNPEDAEKEYEKARKKFRFIKPASVESTGLYLESLECLASVREQMNLNNHAASAMEEAARAIENAADANMKDFVPKLSGCLQRGSYFYRINSQFDLASKLLIRAASGEADINAAIKMLDDACQIQEDENRFKTCHAFYDGAVKFLVENKRYKDASAFLDRQNKMFIKDMELYGKRIWRNIMSKMIIQFHLKDVHAAQQIFYEGMQQFDSASKCDENELCQQLLGVFERADEEQLTLLQKKAQFGIYLINSVSRMAVKLNMTDIQPTIVVDESEEKEQEKAANIEQAKENITDEQLKSDAAHVEVGDDGAPNLL